MPKVSVIIPVYNASAYIERCVRSLFEQTLDDIEYIFINDCSPDDSIDILNRVLADYPKRKVQTRIFEMSTNSRQAAVRRAGIKLASGEYIIHCDSDDWVDTHLYERMYKEAIRSNADIVICPVRNEYKSGGKTKVLPYLPNSCQEVLENWFHNSIAMFTVNKLVKGTVYKENDLLPFDGINMWEDNGLFLRTFYYAKGLSTIDDAVYHYNRTNINAMTAGYGRDAVDQMIKCAGLIDSFFKSKPDGKRFEKTVLALKLFARLNLITDNYVGLKEYESTYSESNTILSEIGLKAFSLKGKIRFLFVKYHLAWLFVTLFKLKNVLLK